jgi:hypothetical protein
MALELAVKLIFVHNRTPTNRTSVSRSKPFFNAMSMEDMGVVAFELRDKLLVFEWLPADNALY